MIALADVLQGADAVRFDSPSAMRRSPIQPWLRWEPGMRSLTNAPIVIAGVVVGDPWRAGRTRWLRGSATRFRPNGNRASRFPLLEGESSLGGLFAFRPTKEDTRASRVAPTSPSKAADRLGRRVSSRRSLPCPRARVRFALGLAVWRDSLRRTPPWRRRFAVRRRSRQQPMAARNSVAPRAS